MYGHFLVINASYKPNLSTFETFKLTQKLGHFSHFCLINTFAKYRKMAIFATFAILLILKSIFL